MRLYGHRIAWIVLLSILLSSCDETPPRVTTSIAEQSFIEIAGIRVPVFVTAAEQFNYTRSWFADIGEKRAALQAFLSLYPEKKRLCGMAALDLAYLELGSDYRFAAEHSSLAAIKDYKNILHEYGDLPEIQVKAYWYIGWIYAGLLKDPQKGNEYFYRIVSEYGNEQISLLSPPPWVSIIHPREGIPQASLNSPPEKHWAALALLEIVRHSEKREEAWSAFARLWREYRNNAATGFALQLILEERLHVDEALVIAQEFLEKKFSNVHVLGDIQRQIQTIRSERGDI